ncbi:MAG: hypothetical protein ACREDS_10115, partial [Limisphaerales bacterium]
HSDAPNVRGGRAFGAMTMMARIGPSPPAFLLGFVRKIAEKWPSFSESFSSAITPLQLKTNSPTTR